ncbi:MULTISPECIES: CpaD family pilus assembly lipoprotein [Mesorhizobium]|jgi:pilus assembly protein CpaD|uniref:CpaD family pilus assembly lipoprotein n=1 Tax=Mesorhizobium TaxID=68287 RepID=UPI0007A940E8|nr:MULTISPECIES: CpaD family pilus assembly lipoprotein [Mesorhizobium]RUU11068.1 hypothetical protein EOD10_19355 [Mesorhizobium sp. M7A.T.Ca.TU.009.01.3.2]RUV05959.1 hypothetical protein EOD00_20885 [Mesorhizobium sp. M7A.T.Ca.TU.009.01.3.1]RUX05679.1 hypothetical protein EOA35_07205 [Mesorhizobium sp. M8A.F.Ca.ET.023.01.1.1]RUX07947.1 hypothetical protein EOA30_07680 [Mesorhizobium sp. M8A.F.Ca.ET.059.01.1.1]RUY11307.1 hypothetical protein EOA25_06355 [Mesorhizobium sp. M2A.F.Ca.ET.040.01.1
MLRFIILFVALAPSVSGCTSTTPVDVEPSAPMLVREETTVLTLQSLRASERQRLRVFLDKASRGRFDAIHLLISGSPQLSAGVAHQARQLAIEEDNIQLRDQHDAGSVRIEAIVYHARPPVCPSYGALPNEESFKQPLGCSTGHNLAVMVNDPRDLLDNQAVKAGDGDRASVPVATYRTFGTDKGG